MLFSFQVIMEETTVEADLLIEAVEDDEMPNLVETVTMDFATSADQVQSGEITSTEEQFSVVSVLY